MNRQTIMLAFLVLLSFNAHARRTPISRANDNAITGQLGLGAIGGYLTVSGGLEYEHFLPAQPYLSFTVKALAYVGGTIAFGELDEGETYSKNYGCYIAPGLRFHPMKHGKIVDLGLGVSTPIGSGNRRDIYARRFQNTETYKVHDLFASINGEFTCNFQARNGGLFSLFINAGLIYSNAHKTVAGTSNDPIYFQLGFRFGGRW